MGRYVFTHRLVYIFPSSVCGEGLEILTSRSERHAQYLDLGFKIAVANKKRYLDEVGEQSQGKTCTSVCFSFILTLLPHSYLRHFCSPTREGFPNKQFSDTS